MTDFIQVTCTNLKKELTDIAIAMLAHIGFEGFEEGEDALTAYIDKDNLDKMLLKNLSEQLPFSYRIEVIAPRNWNTEWENNFEPVVIDDFIMIRAHFHQPMATVQHDIIITPKMSFGTGHHATTTLMIQQMRDINFTNKTVLDFGTGTGILAILAKKLGAATVLAIDNDEWSIENCRENTERNGCRDIQIEQRNDAGVKRSFDIILANINRNVIVDNLSFLSANLNAGGCLLLSGLLADDEEMICAEAALHQLTCKNKQHRLQWISLLYSR